MSQTGSDIVANLKAYASQSGPQSAHDVSRLANAFLWDCDPTKIREIDLGKTSLQVGRTYLGSQPATLFASSTTNLQGRLVEDAALYGYHASVRWGVLADRHGLTAFNSHWLFRKKWFRLPVIAWADLEPATELLNAFSPDGLSKGLPERIALATNPMPNPIQSVDDALVDRLDTWRVEALRIAKSTQGVDEQLQTLFSQLFVLRTIEDKKLAPQLRPISTVLGQNGMLNYVALATIFEQARTLIGSELFDEVFIDKIPSPVVFGIISDLYHGRNLPSGSRYNFSWIDSDILGLAYEKYLSTVLQPAPLRAQLELFTAAERDVNRVSVRRANGVFYTPPYITKFLASDCLKHFYETRSDKEVPRILDFACGSGSFLVAALDALLRIQKEVDPSRNWAKELIEGGFINGVDIDEKAVTVARLNLWNRLTEEPNPLPLPKLSAAVRQGDGLDADTWKPLADKADIVLGNPPFLATMRVSNKEMLEGRFATAHGRFDYSYLFVEQAVEVSSPGGIIGLVIPNRLFRNQNGSIIRDIITSRMNIIEIVDFGANEVFVGVSAYIGCLVAVHQKVASQPARTVKVVEVDVLPENMISQVLIDDEEFQVSNSAIRSFRALHPRGTSAWNLLSPAERSEQIQVSDAARSLSEVAAINQGIRTGANDIFILDAQSVTDTFGTKLTNGLGDTFMLEGGLLRAAAYGSELQKFEAVRSRRFMIYPYEQNAAINESDLLSRFPLTFEYLNFYRDVLSARSSLSKSGLRWYELIRRRNESWLCRPKLLLRDLAQELSFAADVTGEVFLIGGTAVTPANEDHLLALLAYLNSKPIDQLVRRLTPQFRGSYQKFEPQHLQKIPVLERFFHDQTFFERLADIGQRILETGPNNVSRVALETELDEFVGTAIRQAGVSEEK